MSKMKFDMYISIFIFRSPDKLCDSELQICSFIINHQLLFIRIDTNYSHVSSFRFTFRYIVVTNKIRKFAVKIKYN